MAEMIDFFSRLNAIAKAGVNPVDAALSVINTPEGQEALRKANLELEWNWQDWLHTNADENKRWLHDNEDLLPVLVKRDVANDWKQRKRHCPNCKGLDNCTKPTAGYVCEIYLVKDIKPVQIYSVWRGCNKRKQMIPKKAGEQRV